MRPCGAAPFWLPCQPLATFHYAQLRSSHLNLPAPCVDPMENLGGHISPNSHLLKFASAWPECCWQDTAALRRHYVFKPYTARCSRCTGVWRACSPFSVAQVAAEQVARHSSAATVSEAVRASKAEKVHQRFHCCCPFTMQALPTQQPLLPAPSFTSCHHYFVSCLLMKC